MSRCRGLWGHARDTLSYVFGEPLLSISDLDDVVLEVETEQEETHKQNEVIRALQLLANAGSSSHRIENIGYKLCNALGLPDNNISVLPSLLTVTFNGNAPDKMTRSVTVKLEPNLSLNRLERIDGFLEAINSMRLPPSFISAVVSEASAVNNLFSWWVQLLAGALTNGACALAFFSQGWNGAIISTLIGLLIMGPLGLISTRYPSFEILFGPFTGFFAGFICRSMVVLNLLPRGCLRGAELSTIVNIAPGTSLALASLELASKAIVSGTSRLVSALAVAFLIGVGLSFGEELAGIYDPLNATSIAVASKEVCPAVSLWWLFLSFPLTCATFFILLDTPFRRWVICFLSGSLAFFTMFGLSYTPLSAGVQNTIAGAAVGIFGSIYGTATLNPSITPIFAGMLFLVPGALAVSSLQGVLTSASNFGLEFLLVSVSIAIGLLVASVPKFHRNSPNRLVNGAMYPGMNILL